MALTLVAYETNFRNVTATLRKIADEIDSGSFGIVGEVALVLMGDTVEVFGIGPHSDATSAAVLLQAGALRLISAVERHGS